MMHFCEVHYFLKVNSINCLPMKIIQDAHENYASIQKNARTR